MTSSADTDRTPAKVGSTYAFRRRLPQNAVGAAIFSLGMVAKVPYFGTILPYVRRMEPGHCEVVAPNWFGVHNHLGTFHAIAACNLAETAMGMLMEASTPTDLRWIPKAMSSQYLAKATTRLTAVAHLDAAITADSVGTGAEITVPISIIDTHGVEVVHCDITCWVTPK